MHIKVLQLLQVQDIITLRLPNNLKWYLNVLELSIWSIVAIEGGFSHY